MNQMSLEAYQISIVLFVFFGTAITGIIWMLIQNIIYDHKRIKELNKIKHHNG